jgi:hypothetical protein
MKPIGSIRTLLSRYSRNLHDVDILDSGSFSCRVSKSQLAAMRFDPHIDQIQFKPNIELASYSLYTLTTSAYNPASSMPSVFRGQGINAATFETGLSFTTTGWDVKYYPYGNFVGCLGNLNGTGIQTLYPPWDNWAHSQETFKCLWQTAPYANHFHVNSLDYTYIDSENFLINKAIQSVSMSVSHGAYQSCSNKKRPTIFPEYNAHSRYMTRIDEWAYRWPYPVFNNPAGNWGSDYEVHWQCYNALSVGNVRHTELSHYETDIDAPTPICNPQGSCTQTRNPPQLWGGPNLREPLTDPDGFNVYPGYSSDREMPYLVAPGFTPSPGIPMVDQSPACLEGPLWCGTSYSAPILNGIVASVLSADSRMHNRPHVVWAVMLSTAENVEGGEWNRVVDGRDGAGVVSGANAVHLARNHASPGPNGTAETYAVTTANIGRTTPNGSTAKYNIKIPNPLPAGKHLRIVLTWTSNPVRSPTSHNYLSDLDLSWVGDNWIGRTSTSYNGNVEIIDVPVSEVTAGGTYQATITLWANRIPSNGISTSLKYAIVWNWVKDHAQ